MIPPSERGIPQQAWYTPLRDSTEHYAPQEVEDYRRHLERATMPVGSENLRHSVGWPFNDAVMKNSHTHIISFHSAEHPGITLQTQQKTTVRSPVDATVALIKIKESRLISVTLSSQPTNLAVVLEELVSNDLGVHLDPGEELLVSSGGYPVHAGRVIGNIREPPLSRVTLSLAFKPNRFGTQPEPEDLVDPLPFLRRLYQ